MTARTRILIVDDERLARQRIRGYLETHHPELEVTEARDGVEAVTILSADPPDVVFLDIEMPELNGFDTLRQLESRPFKVIFQTAFDQFALKAFDEAAVDYLLKPFTDERLGQALARVLTTPSSNAGKVDAALGKAKRYLDRLLVNVGKRARVVTADEIVYFTSEEHVTRMFLADVDFTISHSLTYLEERLDPERFVRLHRGSIASVDALASVEKGPNMQVTLKNGVKLAVSRERRARVMELLG